MSNCDCCTEKRQDKYSRKQNYQKLVDVSLPPIPEVPLITSSPVTEYRVTCDMRHKPANVPGVRYIQSHSALDYADSIWWHQRRNQAHEPWIGDGNYVERRAEYLHHFGTTTQDMTRMGNVVLVAETAPSHELKYGSILGSRLKEDARAGKKDPRGENSRSGGNKQVCKANATDRTGKNKFVLPMPCDKYMPKEASNKNYYKEKKENFCHDKQEKSGTRPYSDARLGAKDCMVCVPYSKGETFGQKEVRDKRRCDTQAGAEYMVCLPRNKDERRREDRKENRSWDASDNAGKKLIICMPCDASAMKDRMRKEAPVGNVRDKPDARKVERKQRDYLYRCESRELLGSKLLAYCECVKRNGLQDQCPRTPCRGRPACLVKPWPDCWPSGGCYGIDYDRPSGKQRVNPTLQYRRDKKQCGPSQEDSSDVRVVVQQCA